MTSYTLFLDESGRPTYNFEIFDRREKRMFLAAGVAINDKHLPDLDSKFDQILERPNIELHFTDLIQRKGQFNYLKSENDVIQIINSFLELMQNLNIRLYTTVMDKPVYKLQKCKIKKLPRPHQLTWVHIVCRFAEYVTRNEYRGSVVHDTKDVHFDCEFPELIKKTMNDLQLVPRDCSKNISKVNLDTTPVSSQYSRGVQLADICVGLMRRRHIYNDCRFVKKISPLYHNNEYTGGQQEPRMFPAYDYKLKVSVTPKNRRLIVCPNGRYHKLNEDVKSILQKYVIDDQIKAEKFLVNITDKFEIYTETKNRYQRNVTGKGTEFWELQKTYPLTEQQMIYSNIEMQQFESVPTEQDDEK